ncbi:FecR family protein [Flexithrix dorotheae]|uniref:FecR family protein n=1 Tax=Flexithrix dorotheae TaxID=70993 RepID=UPI000377CB00|nr:FecR family protein [Flexithrix dorotheae]
MKYEDYSLEDFLQDEYFVKWVTNPTQANEYFWKSWISEHPERKELILEAKEIINSINFKHHFSVNNKEYIDIFENIHKGNKSEYYNTKSISWFGNNKYQRYAAVIIVVLIAGFSLILNYNILRIQPSETKVKITSKERNTVKGEKLLMKLPDGSEVKLNSETQIRFSENFNKNRREVYLEGEAFFKVTSDTSKPFIIYTGDITTTVLGTSFNISAYPEMETLEVVVVEGKVRVDNNVKNKHKHAQSILLPNDIYTYSKINQTFSTRNADISNRIGWKDGVIIIESASFEEIIKYLERWYGVEFKIEEGIQVQGRFNGRFENKSLEAVLEGLSFSSNITYVINGKIVTLKKEDEPIK